MAPEQAESSSERANVPSSYLPQTPQEAKRQLEYWLTRFVQWRQEARAVSEPAASQREEAE